MNDLEKLSAESINKRCTRVKSVIDNTKSAFLYQKAVKHLERDVYPALQDSYPIFVEEYNKFNAEKFVEVPEDDVHYQHLWEFFPLKLGCNYPYSNINGHRVYNRDYFPRTVKAIEDAVKEDLVMIGLSRMKPNCILKPHTGYNNDMSHNAVLRTHIPLYSPSNNFNELGLAVYADDSARVGQPSTLPTAQHTWEVGKLFTFDDTLLHEAWNKTSKYRDIIMVDSFVNNLVNDKLHLYSPLTNKPVSIKQYISDFQQEVYTSYISANI